MRNLSHLLQLRALVLRLLLAARRDVDFCFAIALGLCASIAIGVCSGCLYFYDIWTLAMRARK